MSNKSNRLKADFGLILKITLSWMIVGAMLTIFDYVTTSASYFYTRTENFHILEHFGTNIGGSFMGGLLGGSFIIFYSNRKLRQKPFLSYILINSFVTFVIVFTISLIVCICIVSVVLKEDVLSKRVMAGSIQFLFNIHVLRTMVFWFTVTMVTSAILRISEKYGPGVLWAMLRGKYHLPVNEERIFMFLDIKSSTTIAEKLGHHKYFNLLNDVFADITDSIQYNKGEIYQYVGDEVVVSWKVQNGIKNNNCLKCFFEAKKELVKQSAKYLKKYDTVPEVKAGMHIGNVTAGEIGVLKKEIAFSGDVLNTTSRIQNECNKYQSNLLISEDLLNKLIIDNIFVVNKIGEIGLRGKQNKIRLCSIENN